MKHLSLAECSLRRHHKRPITMMTARVYVFSTVLV